MMPWVAEISRNSNLFNNFLINLKQSMNMQKKAYITSARLLILCEKLAQVLYEFLKRKRLKPCAET